MESDFLYLMTPQKNDEIIPSTYMLTRALILFDSYAMNLSVPHALKFKRSLAAPYSAEMFLQFCDAERQEHIQDVLDNTL